MININSATPSKEATPGVSGQGQASQAQPSPAQGQGGQLESNVTITAKEYAELQRNQARLQAFQKRAQFTSKNSSLFAPSDTDDPEIVEALRKEQTAHQNAIKELRSEQIKNGVRGLLDKEEYKLLPKVVKDLILKNPALLSKAETVDEALLDIEEFINTQMIEHKINQPPQPSDNTQKGGQGQPQNPSGHETPPIVNAANPAPVNVDALEDINKLEGQSKSRAILRNVLRKARQGKGV